MDVSLALLEVEMFDVVLLPAVNVDGFFVDEHKRAGEIDFADDAGRAGDVDDHEIVAGDGTQADGIGGKKRPAARRGFFPRIAKNSPARTAPQDAQRTR